MPIQLKLFLFTVILTAVVFLVLWAANYPKKYRYKQVLYPVIAFILSTAALLLYANFYTYVQPIVTKVVNYIVGLFISPLPQDMGKFPEYAAALLLILVLAILKSVRSIVFYLYLFFRFIKRKLSGKKKGRKTDKIVDTPTLAYKYDQEMEIVLREKWEFIYLFLNKFAWLVLAIVFICLISLHLVQFPIETPLMTVLALMIILEGAWYLNGPRAEFYTGYLGGRDVKSKIVGDYTDLWKEYQEIWRNKLLLARQSRAVLYPEVKAENFLGVFKQGEDNSEELQISAGYLTKEGYSLTQQDCFILKELYRYNDIIIADSDYNHMAPVIFSALIRTVMRQHNVLIVVPHSNIHHSTYTKNFKEWTNNWFMKLAGASNIGDINFFSRFDPIHEEDRILIAAADDLLEEKTINHEWFSNLKTVLFIDVTEMFSLSLTSGNILLNILRKGNRTLQCVVVANYRQALESSIRRNLDIKGGAELRKLKDKPAMSSILVWQLEGRDTFQEKVYAGDIWRSLGAEAVLAVLPWRDNLENIFLSSQEKVCWGEYLEELENSKSSLHEKIDTQTIDGSLAKDRIKCSPVSYLMERSSRKILLSRDNEYNLVINLIKSSTYAVKEILLHVVSPPYLLREYLVDNFSYFYKTPIFALTSKMMVSKFSLALSLMERLILIGLSENEILEDIHRIKPGANDARKELKELFELAFNIDILKSDFLNIQPHYDFNRGAGTFDEQHIFRLSPGIKKHFYSQPELRWLKRIKIVDEHGKPFDEIYMDHVFQNYLPGQIHAFSSKTYRIGQLDESMSILRITHVSPVNITYYRPEIKVELNRLEPPCLAEYRITERSGDIETVLELCEASFDITTMGYHFLEGRNLKSDPMKKDEKIRNYSLGRVLKIDFYTENSGGINTTVVSSNLVVLLKGLMVTFFPETHQYIIVCSNTADKKISLKNRMLFPEFKDNTAKKDKIKSAKRIKCVSLHLFEDSHHDLGLLQSVFDKWKYIFKVLDDYVSWVLDEPEDEEVPDEEKGQEKEKKGEEFEIERGQLAPEDNEIKIDRHQYLKLFTGEVPDFIDMDMTSAFLRILVGDNDLTRARDEFYTVREEEAVEIPKGVHQCDFCAKPLPQAEIEVLEDDGRERCKECRDSAINHVRHATYKDLNNVYNEARDYFRTELRLDLRENIDVEFTTAEEISKHIGKEFVTTPKFDPRVVGFAVSRGKKHIIKIENGSPYHLTLGTMVHELTHIWQEDHLDRNKMEAEHGLLLIEGHAVWAELNVLEIKGMAEAFREETARRKDEYGEGYQKIVKLLSLKENEKYSNPFEMLKKMYPLHHE